MDLIPQLLNDLWEILDQITNDDPELHLLQKLNSQIGELVYVLYTCLTKQPKSFKKFINTEPNPVGFSQIIRQLLSVDYKSTSIQVAELIKVLSFAKSQVISCLKNNGGQYLFSRHIIKYKENQNQYTKCVEQLSTGDISSLVLKTIFYHFSIAKCTLVTILVNNQVDPIFIETFLEMALQQENSLEVINIVHAISWLIQSQKYNSHVNLGKIIFNMTQCVKQDSQFKIIQQNDTSKKDNLDDLKYELDAQQKRQQIAQINSKNIQDQINELKGELNIQTPMFQQQKDVLELLKMQLLPLQAQINSQDTNTTAQFQKERNLKFTNLQHQLRQQETKVNEILQFIDAAKNKISLKEKQIVSLAIIITSNNQEIKNTQNKINQILGIAGISSLHQNEEIIQDISLNIDQTPLLFFNQVFLSYFVKIPEGLKYFSQQLELGQNFCIIFSSLNKSPQLMTCINFLSDALLLENDSRENIKSLLSHGQMLDQKVSSIDQYGQGIFYPIMSGLLEQLFNSNVKQSLTYIYMYLDGIERAQYQREVPTSFVGNKFGQNLSITYMINLIYRLLEIGIFESIIIQICSRSDTQVVSTFLYILSEFLTICRTYVPSVYNYFRYKIFIPVNSYSNKFSQNQLLLDKTKSLVQEVNEQSCHDYLIEEEKYFSTITKKSQPQHNQLFFTDAQLDNLCIKEFEFEPLKWNWEQLNIVIHYHINSQFIVQHQKIIQQVLKFIDSSLQEEVTIKSDINYQFSFLPAIPDLQLQVNYEIFDELLKSSNKYVSLITLPICSQTTRIGQICLNLLNKLIQFQSGIDIIKQSNLFQMLFMNLKVPLENAQYDRVTIQSVTSIIGILTQSFECCQLLDDYQIIELIYQIQIQQNHPSLTSFLIMSLSPSAQSTIEQKSTLCMCGMNCLRKHSQNDKIKVIIQQFLESTDVRIRYQGVNRLAQSFRKREYYLAKSKPLCGCLCQNCSNVPHQSLLISQDDVKWALYCLVPMINDVQPEIAVACMCIIEEVVTIDDLDIFIDNQINLDNWKNVGQYLRVKLMQSEKGCKYLGEQSIIQSLNQQWIYRWIHNLEYKQFLTLTRQLCSTIKDPNYDKIIPKVNVSSDIYYTTQDQFSYDFMCLPHNNSYGRVVIQLPESYDDIPQIVQKDFWQNRRTIIQNQTFQSCQAYSRGSVFTNLAQHSYGRYLIQQSGVLQEIQVKLFSTDIERFSYRGAIWVFGLIVSHEGAEQLFDKFNEIIDLILDLAVTCKFEKTRFAAFQVLQVMVNNKQIQNFLDKKQFSFNRIQMRDKTYTVVDLPPHKLPLVYNGLKHIEHPIFNIDEHEITVESQIKFVSTNSENYTQPMPIYSKFCEEKGIIFQDQIQTNLLGIAQVPNFKEILMQNIRIDKRNQFALQIEKLRELEQVQQQVQIFTDEAMKSTLKLCLVDNLLDAQAGIQQLRQTYQKDFRAEIFFFQLLQRQNCSVSVIKEVSEIFGQGSPEAVDYLVEVENCWI